MSPASDTRVRDLGVTARHCAGARELPGRCSHWASPYASGAFRTCLAPEIAFAELCYLLKVPHCAWMRNRKLENAMNFVEIYTKHYPNVLDTTYHLYIMTNRKFY